MEPERLARLAESARQLADVVEQLVDELDDADIVADADVLADVHQLRTIAGRIEAQASAVRSEGSESTGAEAFA